MLHGLRDYARCVARNRFALAGYASIVLSFLSEYIEHETHSQLLVSPGDIMFYAGLLNLAATQAGIGTYDVYKITREHIDRHGTIDSLFKKLFSSSYCARTGLLMAAEESGLGYLL